jgi:serpin B
MLPIAPFLLATVATPDFATRLWQATPTGKGNVVISPTSVEACLALLIPAVGPVSQPPLAKTLGITVPAFPTFQQDLKKRLAGLTSGPETTVSNAGFFAEAPRASYVAAIAKLYGATAERLQADPLKQVNGWVDKKTKGRIPKLFDQLDGRTHAILVNTVTFDGDWSLPFPKEATKKAAFGGRTVDMMHLAKAELFYSEASAYRSVQLRYAGGRYLMTILLPNAGDPASLLDSDGWRTAPTTSRPVDLFLPKFTIRSSPDVKGALRKMGLAPLFNHIDLSPALPGGGADQISEIVHRTYIKVDEKGTKAAAATGIVMTKAIRIPQPPVVFRVDRPFAFAIQSVQSGEVLFQGVIREP